MSSGSLASLNTLTTEVDAKRKTQLEDVIEDSEIFTKFERWLQRTCADPDLVNELYFYRDVQEWRRSKDTGFFATAEEWSDCALAIIKNYLLSGSPRPFLGMMLDATSEITLDHDMFNDLSTYVYDILLVKFVIFQSESKLMVNAVRQGSEMSNSHSEEIPSDGLRKSKKKKTKLDDEEIALKKPEQALLESVFADEKTMAEFKERHKTENQFIDHHVAFVAHVLAFQEKFKEIQNHEDFIKEAKNIYNTYVKETPKGELPIRSTVRKNLEMAFSENGSIDSNMIFYPALVCVIRSFPGTQEHRTVKRSMSLTKNKKSNTLEPGGISPRSKKLPSPRPNHPPVPLVQPVQPVQPPPRVVKREMFNIYPDGSPDQV
eukprot:TRINITY_DN10957_c0_g1_i2.p1 TRINITY_DN10957_c0_g1~~TRINITY_DN10957_c0_g1_i2.p1  ORF type:complete len:375 (-),score=56.74 TRINITY_DN10957_c0_g1_i2:60-1184(-)